MHCLSCGNVASEETNDKTGYGCNKETSSPNTNKKISFSLLKEFRGRLLSKQNVNIRSHVFARGRRHRTCGSRWMTPQARIPKCDGVIS